MLVPATLDHMPWIRGVVRAGAREGSFEREIAEPGSASELFFANLSRAIQSGYFMVEDATGEVRDIPARCYVYTAPEAAGTPIGLAFFKALPGDIFELWLTAIDPAWRRRGHGTAMLRAALTTPSGQLAYLARVNTDGALATAMGRLLVAVGYRLERAGTELAWYVHQHAPAALVEVVRRPRRSAD